MSRKSLLTKMVVLLILLGGGAVSFLLASALAPGARARAGAIELEVQSLAPASLQVFPVAASSGGRSGAAVVAIRGRQGRVSFWMFPWRDGLVVMPHARWSDLAVTCARLEVSRASPSATEELRCATATSEDFANLGRWRWRLDGSPAVAGIPPLMPARVGLVRGRYLLGASDELP